MEKSKTTKIIITQVKKFFVNSNQHHEDVVKASFAISKIIAKSSRPFKKNFIHKKISFKDKRHFMF